MHWAGTLRSSWHLLIWVPWSQWILKIDAGCNYQTCFDSYVVTSILEDGSLVSSRSFMPLCYLKESRQCLKEPVIISNQKKRWGGFAQGHRKEILYVKDVECRVHWKKRLDWAINKSQKYHSTTTIAGFIIHDRIAIMGDFMSLIVYPPDNQRPVFYWSLGRGTFELDFKQPWRVAERFGFTRLHYRLKLNQGDMIQLRWTKKNTRN